MEVWKEIKGFEGMYSVSSWGNVKSMDRSVLIEGRFLRFIPGQNIKQANCKGYRFVALSVNDKQKTLLVHRLLAEAFVPNPDNKPEVNHKDLNTCNNSFTNLSWVTGLENKEYSRKLKCFLGV
jgi:hypothetical protein